MMGKSKHATNPWRGDIVVAKYESLQSNCLVDVKMADFVLVRNYFQTHGSPQVTYSASRK
jgi:hypothetical protein